MLLRVVSTRGDTLAGAHVTVTRRRPDHGALLPPLEAQAPDSGGWYRLGPLRSSENLVEVAHPGYRPARYTVQLCTTDTVWLLASLFPE